MANDEEIGVEFEDTWYLRRLDSGLYTLQTVDFILAWIIMEDDGVRFPVPFGSCRFSNVRIDSSPCSTNA